LPWNINGRDYPFRHLANGVMSATAQMRSVTLPRPVPPIFLDVLCAIDGTRTAARGVDRACELAAPGARLTILACEDERGSGLWASAVTNPARAHRRLRRAVGRARTAGFEAEAVLEPQGSVVDEVFEHAASHGLLALGAPVVSRWAGLLIGGVTSKALHQLPSSLLIARAQPLATGEQILLAIGGPQSTPGLIDAAAYAARRLDRGVLMVHAVEDESRSAPHHLAAQQERLAKALGREPELVVAPDDPVDLIVRVARERGISLIVMGSRRVGGLRALGSVTEKAAYQTNCSILVVHTKPR
jgi:nucleotide-binding universal stress UspA family protein